MEETPVRTITVPDLPQELNQIRRQSRVSPILILETKDGFAWFGVPGIPFLTLVEEQGK